MSSNDVGCISRSSERIGAAVELEHAERVAAAEQLVGRLGRRGRASSRTTVSPRLAWMLARQSSSTVRLRRPRKSIFSRPSDSHAPMSNWVMIAPSCSRRLIGMTSSSGSRHRITPAACTPHWRFRPSSPRAVSTTLLTSGSVS